MMAEILAQIVNEHPYIQTAELEDKMVGFAQVHLAAAFVATDDEEPPHCQVSICVLIALLREILNYREKYGLLEPPESYISSEKEISNHEQTGHQRRSHGDREVEPRTGCEGETKRTQPESSGRSCRKRTRQE